MDDFQTKVTDALTEIKVAQATYHGEVKLIAQRVQTLEDEKTAEKWQRYGFTVLNMLLAGLGIKARLGH